MRVVLNFVCTFLAQKYSLQSSWQHSNLPALALLLFWKKFAFCSVQRYRANFFSFWMWWAISSKRQCDDCLQIVMYYTVSFNLSISLKFRVWTRVFLKKTSESQKVNSSNKYLVIYHSKYTVNKCINTALRCPSCRKIKWSYWIIFF